MDNALASGMAWSPCAARSAASREHPFPSDRAGADAGASGGISQVLACDGWELPTGASSSSLLHRLPDASPCRRWHRGSESCNTSPDRWCITFATVPFCSSYTAMRINPVLVVARQAGAIRPAKDLDAARALPRFCSRVRKRSMLEQTVAEQVDRAIRGCGTIKPNSCRIGRPAWWRALAIFPSTLGWFLLPRCPPLLLDHAGLVALEVLLGRRVDEHEDTNAGRSVRGIKRWRRTCRTSSRSWLTEPTARWAFRAARSGTGFVGGLGGRAAQVSALAKIKQTQDAGKWKPVGAGAGRGGASKRGTGCERNVVRAAGITGAVGT